AVGGVAGDIRVEVTVAEVDVGGRGVELLHDADAPHAHVGPSHAVDGCEVGDTRHASRARSRTRGRSRIEGACAGVVATSIRGTPVRGLAVLAVDRGVA